MNLSKHMQAAVMTAPYKTFSAAQAYEATMSEKNPVRLGGKIKALFDEYMKECPPVEEPFELACRKGCNFCCHLKVDTTMPEVLHLIDWMKKNLTKDEITVIRDKATSKWEETSVLDEEAAGFVRTPCPLLKDGLCGVYEARPINCRGFHSVDLSKCEEGFYHPEKDGFNAFWAGPMAISKDIMHGHLTGLMIRKKTKDPDKVSYRLEEALAKAL